MGGSFCVSGVTEAFKADKSPKKINLGVGAYVSVALVDCSFRLWWARYIQAVQHD